MSTIEIRDMKDAEKSEAAKKFAETWEGQGYEKGQTQPFWIQLLRNVFGVVNPEQYITFEQQTKVDESGCFADCYIDNTKVLIEQKSIDKDLRKAIKQSNGEKLTAFEQAKKYAINFAYDKRPRWIITCNFKSFLIYDMNHPTGDPVEILLEDLEREWYILEFVVEKNKTHVQKELEVSVKAGELIGSIYDAFLKQYNKEDIENGSALKNLNKLCVRLVFCLYAEDAGIFEPHNLFHDYMNEYDTDKMRKALKDLFVILNTKVSERDHYLDGYIAKFPYVNGGLFAEDIDIPPITEEIRDMILNKASADFNWSTISPTIFGAVFESTLNPETRRSGGMHYTSIENIHKVIDPLFLDDLEKELEEIEQLKQPNAIKQRVEKFQDKLSSLKFLDPACGSGNFLTESYMSLRRLENRALQHYEDMFSGGQISLGEAEIISPIKVNINQFYGIEINDFASIVASTALWIAESQMLKETNKIIHQDIDFLPLKSYTNITEGNALRLNWDDVLKNDKCNYIMGNPPFVGQSFRSSSQSDDMAYIFGKGEIETKLDYVICWYKKALEYMKNNKAQIAFVSTNSICQGESVPTFWKNIVEEYNVEIQFAHKDFIWDSEANQKAHVHCVIVGITNYKIDKEKLLFKDNRLNKVKHINPYIIAANDIWVENRTNKPKNNMPKMTTGSPPTDDGGLLLTPEEKNELIKKYPELEKCIKPFIGAREFLHDKIGEYSRYCLWFDKHNYIDYIKIPEIRVRLERVKNLRLNSNADRIKKMADYPYLFCQNRQPNGTYLIIPRVSSEKRKYIPIGFMDKDIIASDACTIVPDMPLWYFSIMTSNVHMAWMRIICGRLKSDYRYSPIVYNNFPWPELNDELKLKLEKNAKAILDARKLYSNYTLDRLYDGLGMPEELKKAHQENDIAVMKAYGFDASTIKDESDCVVKLFEMYQETTKKK